MELINLRAVEVGKRGMQPLHWRVTAAQHWIITGARASGKTLLAEALAGKRRLVAGTLTYPFQRGDLSYEQRAAAIRLVTFMDNSRLARNPTNVHYYQQRYNAFDASGHPTVRQYLQAGGNRVTEDDPLIEAFGIGDLLELEKIKLSSGQTRKVLLARELLRTPRILIIDNPYVGLDLESRQTLNDLLDRLVVRLGITLIMTGHVTELPKSITHRLHLREDGTNCQGRVGAFTPEVSACSIDKAVLERVRMKWADPSREIVSPEIIRFEQVTLRYGALTLYERLNWVVQRGEKWVVSGRNGSGKSALLSLVYADHPLAYAREIYLFGERRGRGGSIWDIKRRIGFTSPELHTYFREPMSVRHVLLTGFSDTFVLPRRTTEDQEEMVDDLLAYFGLADQATQLFLYQSSGTQRLILLCRALVKAPPLLLLDEPFQGLDEAAVFRARKLLETVLGPVDTVLFISHFRPEVPGGMEWRELELGRPGLTEVCAR